MGLPTPRLRTSGSAVVLAASMAALLTACGGGGSPKASASGPSASSATSAPASPGSVAAGNRAGGSFSGASGSVAAIQGSSMEVQNPSTGQTTVNWTSATTFDQTLNLTASSLTPGECVTVTGSTANGTITARSVAVTPASSSGTCANAFGTGRRGRFAGGPRNGSLPPGSVPGSGSGARRAFPTNIGFAGGKVVSASATSLVLYGTSFTGGFGSNTATSTPPTTAAPANVTVTVTSSTVFTQEEPAAATDLAVGDCVVANGPADSTGAVAAKTIRITSTGGKSCSTGFGRFGGGSSGGGAPAASSSASD